MVALKNVLSQLDCALLGPCVMSTETINIVCRSFLCVRDKHALRFRTKSSRPSELSSRFTVILGDSLRCHNDTIVVGLQTVSLAAKIRSSLNKYKAVLDS